MKPSILVTKLQSLTENLDDAVFQSLNRGKNIYTIYTAKNERAVGSKIMYQLSGFTDGYIKIILATQKSCDQLTLWLNSTKEEIEVGSKTFNSYNDFLDSHPHYDFLQELLDLVE
jgi:hypothetical protein